MKQSHISFTQIAMYMKCGRQYMYRYEEGLIIPPNGALIVGFNGHRTVENNHVQKIQSLKDLPVSDWQEFFVESFDSYLKNNETKLEDGEKPGELKDQGVGLVTEYRNAISPKVIPIKVEDPFDIDLIKLATKSDKSEILNGISVKGAIDVIAKKNIICDTKFRKSKTNQNDVDEDLQLTIYAIAFREKYKEKESELIMDVVTKTKVPASYRMKTKRFGHQIVWAKNAMVEVVKCIQGGAFPPCDPSCWWCSPKWCGYFNICKAGKKMVSYSK